MNAAAKVGIFMLIILGILAFFILRIEDLNLGGARAVQEIQVTFDSVAGLDDKSAVRVAGVRVGKVSGIRLTEEGRAVVTLEVDGDIDLRQGATARIANLGLLGEKYVDLIPGPPGNPVLADTDRPVHLEGTSSASIEQVTDQVAAIADDLKAITASIRTTVGGPSGEQRLDEIVENVRQITASMRILIDSNQENVAITADNLRAITTDLRVELPRIARAFDQAALSISGTVSDNREDIRIIVENLRRLSTDIQTTADNLGDVTAQVRSGEGTVGKLLYSDEAHERLTSALSSVESGVGELQKTLGRIGKIDLKLGIQGDYYAGLDDVDPGLGSNSRTAVVVDLQPDPERNRFYHVELANVPRGDKDVKVVERTVTLPDGTTETSTVREEKFDRDFLISAQAGWKLDALVVRLGLFENTGGIGADYHLNDRLRLTGEIFDFGKYRDDNPHLRLFSQYVISSEKETLPQIYVSTGVDNVFNDTAFTIGGGIRWTDEDLKYLLGSIPMP